MIEKNLPRKNQSLLLIFVLLFGVFFISGLIIKQEEVQGAIGLVVKWQFDGSGNFVDGGTPIAADINQDGNIEVLVGDYDGNFWCLDKNGNELWQVYSGGHINKRASIADIDKDHEVEILFASEYGTSNNTIFCLDSSGDTEWSYSVYDFDGAIGLALGDLDGDGYLEAVFGADSRNVYCLNHDGTVANGWPYHHSDNVDFEFIPAIADIDDDPELEVLIPGTIGLFCLSHVGNLQWIYDDYDDACLAPIINDIDNDGKLEIIYENGPSDKLWVVEGGSSSATLDWSYDTGGSGWYCSPAVANLDADDNMEIVVTSKSEKAYILDGSGSIQGDPISFDEASRGSPTIADLDGDGDYEIVLTKTEDSAPPVEDSLRIYSHTGDLIVSYDCGDVNSGTTIVDIDNDGIYEILISSSIGDTVYCLDITGVTQSGDAPWYTDHGTLFNNGWMDSDSDLVDDLTEDFYGTSPSDADSDDDGLTDGEEVINFGCDPMDADSDDDDLDDYEEIMTYQTDPSDTDSDDDTYSDWEEVTVGTDPNDPADNPGVDTDGDGLPDCEETNGVYEPSNPYADGSGYLYTDPTEPDSDFDGLPDYEEVYLGEDNYYTNPNDPDSDGDELDDNEEINGVYEPDNPYADGSGNLYTNPNEADSDGDSIDDKEEIFLGSDNYYTDPNATDSDGDGLDDLEEVTEGSDTYETDPTDPDSDDDDLTDGEEQSCGTDPNDEDYDGDGLLDGEEVNTYGTSPTDDDHDDDGLLDGEEVNTHQTDPTDPDSDDDGLDDQEEVTSGSDGYLTDPTDSDSDADGLEDGEEQTYATDPTDPDTDADGYSDYTEVTEGTDPTDPLDYPETPTTTPPPETTTPPETSTTPSSTKKGDFLKTFVTLVSLLTITAISLVISKRKRK
ncbi:MAG: hypothetical protein GF364_16710 [Candidatus Lokiarchaeota archaeon]|nr:hypothetical protein [Candidatus Lokiarchaeota archaeon]